MPPPGERPLSALPSTKARALAFVSILVAGVCGALIGSSFVRLQCDGCTTATGLGAVAGGVVAAGGVAVVAVLVLRAMGEWRRIEAEDAARAAAERSAAGNGSDAGPDGDEAPPGGRLGP